MAVNKEAFLDFSELIQLLTSSAKKQQKQKLPHFYFSDL